MSVKIHRKEYKTVAERVNDIHANQENLSITTELVSWEGGIVIMKATVTILKADNPDSPNVFTGHAYEKEGSTQINKTSALENCETSAIGRALAAAGYGGTEYASANEVENAIHQQKAKPEKSLQELNDEIDKKFNDKVSRDVDKELAEIQGKLKPSDINKILISFKAFHVTGEMLCAKIGKPSAEWDMADKETFLLYHAELKKGKAVTSIFPEMKI